MREPLNARLDAIRQMIRAADRDLAVMQAQPITAEWLADYANQRAVNSFLFNFIKIQDKLGGKLFRALLAEWRELDEEMTMIDVLNRLEKLGILDSAETWDRLREVRNAITHEYPDDETLKLANIRLAMEGFETIRALLDRIEHRLNRRDTPCS